MEDVDVSVPTVMLGLLGGLLVLLSYLGQIPWWLGYSLGGALLSFYAAALSAVLRSRRLRRPSAASPVGRRAFVVEAEGDIALVKVDGVYWRAVCRGCRPGGEAVVRGFGDLGLEVEPCG